MIKLLCFATLSFLLLLPGCGGGGSTVTVEVGDTTIVLGQTTIDSLMAKGFTVGEKHRDTIYSPQVSGSYHPGISLYRDDMRIVVCPANPTSGMLKVKDGPIWEIILTGDVGDAEIVVDGKRTFRMGMSVDDLEEELSGLRKEPLRIGSDRYRYFAKKYYIYVGDPEEKEGLYYLTVSMVLNKN